MVTWPRRAGGAGRAEGAWRSLSEVAEEVHAQNDPFSIGRKLSLAVKKLLPWRSGVSVRLLLPNKVPTPTSPTRYLGAREEWY